MKSKILLFVLFSCLLLQSAVAATNVLSIYLVAKDEVAKEEEQATYETRVMETKPDRLRLLSPPVLADADFVSFDWTNQTFVITPKAAQRLAAGIWSREGEVPTFLGNGVYELIPFPTPFVVKASGEPVYVGAFYSLVFSSSFPGPFILADTYAISSNTTSNVTLKIELNSPATADPRRDRRIFDALQKLFPNEKR